jgi:SAM-dependent methyltransferase
VNFLKVDSAGMESGSSARVDSGSSVRVDESVAAYDAIAEEYDSPQHRTTGELGRLSRLALQAAPLDDVFDGADPLVVELGCGTGAFTAALAERMRGGRLLITDPAARMLRLAVRQLAPGPRAGRRIASFALRASAAEILPIIATPPDLIVASLADPYLSESLFHDARLAGNRGTRMLVTVPSRRWAIEERRDRLRIPLDRTRFRTEGGNTVHSRSLALDPDELAGHFATAGFEAIAHGAIATDAPSWSPRPEVSWALGRPLLEAVEG